MRVETYRSFAHLLKGTVSVRAWEWGAVCFLSLQCLGEGSICNEEQQLS